MNAKQARKIAAAHDDIDNSTPILLATKAAVEGGNLCSIEWNAKDLNSKTENVLKKLGYSFSFSGYRETDKQGRWHISRTRIPTVTISW